MKLTQIKRRLEESFFKDRQGGITLTRSSELLDSLRIVLAAKPLLETVELERAALEALLNNELHEFNDPSKTLRAFIDGRQAVLTIVEDLGDKHVIIFGAARIGSKIAIADATLTALEPKLASLALVKEALQQAKRLDDDITFKVSHD